MKLVKYLSKLRADRESLQYGKVHFVNASDANIMAYVREHEGFDRLLVVINFGNRPPAEVDITRDRSSISLPSKAEVMLRINSTLTTDSGNDDADLKKVMLSPGEGFIAKWAYSRP